MRRKPRINYFNIAFKVEAVMPAYVLAGHGCDLVLPGAIMDERIVPPGCTYVTYQVCGLVSINYEKIMYTLEHRSKVDMLNRANQEELQDWFGGDIKVHAAGEPYINSYCTYVLEQLTLIVGRPYIEKSGTYEVGKPFLPTNSALRPGGYGRYFTFIQNLPRMITHEMINSIYQGSIFPTASQFTAILPNPVDLQTFMTAVNTVVSHLSMANLFAIRPGIYYNFLCRPPCNPAGDPVAKHIEREGLMANVNLRVHEQLEAIPHMPQRNIKLITNWFEGRPLSRWFNYREPGIYHMKPKARVSVKARHSKATHSRAAKARATKARRSRRLRNFMRRNPSARSLAPVAATEPATENRSL